MKLRSSRRTFARLAAGAAFSVISARKGFSLQLKPQSVEIDTTVEVGTIRPELHSHFAEHLGSCTYGGLWVGKGSTIPNINGFRKAAVEYLKAVGIPVLRWPGGCFADDYHWRDGIGPAEKRPKTVNIHWGNYAEDNSFGTHEFIELCRLIGAEPYLAGNVGSGTPQEFRDWVEYCNYPEGSSLSDERIRNGAREPFKIKYWGVGNENWGCGGNMTPEEYATHYRRFRTYIRNFDGVQPFMIACGPNGNNADWTRKFMGSLNNRAFPNGFAMHYYSNGQLEATKFTPEASEKQLSSFQLVEKAIGDQRTLLDTFDSSGRVGLMVDEWGIWDRMNPDDQKKYGRLFQPITMRCGVGAALGLNVFHRQAHKLIMCNIAQIVNVLHALLLTEGDKCVRTPAYWAFDLMKEHRGKMSVRTKTDDPSALGVSLSASKVGKELIVTFVNPKHDTGLSVNCSIAGALPSGATAKILHHADLNAENSFSRPDTIVPANHQVSVAGGSLKADLPPLSVLTAKITLG